MRKMISFVSNAQTQLCFPPKICLKRKLPVYKSFSDSKLRCEKIPVPSPISANRCMECCLVLNQLERLCKMAISYLSEKLEESVLNLLPSTQWTCDNYYERRTSGTCVIMGGNSEVNGWHTSKNSVVSSTFVPGHPLLKKPKGIHLENCP